jgi:hypothetical protein
VTAVLHSRKFDTVLGRIGSDAKGDVTGFEPWQWFVWQADGTYVPLELGRTALAPADFYIAAGRAGAQDISSMLES